MRNISLLCLIGLLPVTGLAAPKLPVVESIAGAETVSVKGGSKTRKAKAGDEIRYGDRIKTPAKVSVRVLYPDGTQIAVGQNSEAEIQRQEGDTSSQRLHSGQIWGQVTKIKNPVAGKSKPRFIIRTKTAILGVRGTEFVVDQGAKEAQFHTLEGEVEIAKDEAALKAGKVTKLLQDQMLTAKAGKLEVPKAFDRQQFMSALTAKQPQFQQFLQQAPKPYEELEKVRQGVGSISAPPMPSAPTPPAPPTLPPAPAAPSIPQKKIGF